MKTTECRIVWNFSRYARTQWLRFIYQLLKKRIIIWKGKWHLTLQDLWERLCVITFPPPMPLIVCKVFISIYLRLKIRWTRAMVALRFDLTKQEKKTLKSSPFSDDGRRLQYKCKVNGWNINNILRKSSLKHFGF